MGEGTAPRVAEGLCHVIYAYDVGFEIDLGACTQRLKDLSSPVDFKHKHRAPSHFQFQPLPLRVLQPAPPTELGGRAVASVELVVYDFGAVAITYTREASGTFGELAALCADAVEDERLRRDSAARLGRLLDAAGDAVRKPVAPELFEDYVLFQVLRLDPPVSLAAVRDEFPGELARILRAERGALSQQEIAEATSSQVSYGPDDLTLIDWNVAVSFDRDADDVRAVLEFANVQLLELRYLDRELDRTMDRAYELLSRRRRLPSFRRVDLGPVGQMQVDGAVLFERVSNALKLLGDQYLARVYRLASQRLRLLEWEKGIVRKLDTVDAIFQRIADQNANHRIEILEWIIIALIAFEIVMSFVR